MMVVLIDTQRRRDTDDDLGLLKNKQESKGLGQFSKGNGLALLS